MSSSSSIEPGTEIAGFRIERRIGEEVYEATQLSLDRLVALRVLPRGADVQGVARDLPDVYAAGVDGEHAYVAMRLASAGRRRRMLLAAAAAVVVIAAATAILLLSGDDSDDVPAPLPGATVLGSALAGEAESVDCEGKPPSGASLGCTIAQTRLDGRLLRPPRDGVIRRWTVRGASGELGLIVLRGDEFAPAARTPSERVDSSGLARFDAELPVRKGDVIALDVAPGASIGVRRSEVAATARWIGPLRVRQRAIDFGPGTGFDRELLLRLELVPGSVAARRSLTGAAAADAPGGEELTTQPVDVPGGQVRTLAVVRLGDAVVVDLFDSRGRVARAPLPDADPRGEPLGITIVSGTVPTVRWRDPDGSTVVHSYRVSARNVTLRV